MTNPTLLRCDGCGQMASPEHIAKRLQRLEWTTRYRPVHIGALLLGAISPAIDPEFLYSGEFSGEAQQLLDVTRISAEGKTGEAVLAEFQKRGLLLTHVLECPREPTADTVTDLPVLLARQFPLAAARIRRSLRPKRIVAISQWLGPLLGGAEKPDLGAPIILDGDKPFVLDGTAPGESATRLRALLDDGSAWR